MGRRELQEMQKLRMGKEEQSEAGKYVRMQRGAEEMEDSKDNRKGSLLHVKEGI